MKTKHQRLIMCCDRVHISDHLYAIGFILTRPLLQALAHIFSTVLKPFAFSYAAFVLTNLSQNSADISNIVQLTVRDLT